MDGDLAVEHTNDPIGHSGYDVVMGYQHDRYSSLVAQPLEESEDSFDRCAVKAARGFVGKENGRVIRQCSGDGDALTLASRELRRSAISEIIEVDVAEQSPGIARPLSMGTVGTRHGDLDVPQDR
jgi:hypothetical protein